MRIRRRGGDHRPYSEHSVPSPRLSSIGNPSYLMTGRQLEFPGDSPHSATEREADRQRKIKNY